MSTGRADINVFFAAPPDQFGPWRDALARACPEARLAQSGDPACFDAVLYAPGAHDDLSGFTRARLVQSLWAGVERIVTNPTLTQPLARMVDPGLTAGMVEYCVGWALRAHLGMDRYAQDGVWRHDDVPPLARSRQVGVLGMGALGGAVAAALAGLGFAVTGWSASGRGAVPGVACLPAAGLGQVLAGSDVLICLLPDTAATRGMIGAAQLAQMPRGAWLINAGRGTLIDEAALIAALERGPLAHAVLDVFQTEPLPPDHPFWAHPGVTVTPHIAAETRPETAAFVVADNLRRVMAGQEPRHLVCRDAGY